MSGCYSANNSLFLLRLIPPVGRFETLKQTDEIPQTFKTVYIPHISSTKGDRMALWMAMQEGVFDTIGSDHAPKDKKVEDDFFEAAYGSPEVETMLPVVWHFGVNRAPVRT